MEKIMRNKWPFILALLHFGSSFFTDRLFFDYKISDSIAFNTQLILIKVSFFFILWGIYTWIFHILEEIKLGKLEKEKCVYFATYLSINLIVLFLVWPGIWVDMSILEPAKYMQLQTWHHILSSFVDIYSAMILPFPTGVLIVQLIIISTIVAYVTVEANRLIHSKKWSGIIIFSAFFNPAILLYNQNNFRAVLYSYIGLYFALIFYKLIITLKMSRYDLCQLCIWGIILSSWRSEGIIWLLTIIVIIGIFTVTKKTSFRLLVFPIVVVVGFLLIREVNGFYERFDGRNYTLVATLRQADALVLAADSGEDEELLNNIDKCINVDLMLSKPEHDGNWFFWNEYDKYIRNFTKDDFTEYLVSLLKLSIKYPKALLRERVAMFTGAVGIQPQNQKSIVDDTMRFEEDDAHLAAQDILTKSIGGLFVTPINKDVRNKAINILGGRDLEGNITWRSYLFFTACDGLVAILFALIIGFIRKNKGVIVINFAVLLQTILVFLTEPDPNFSYYLPAEIIGRVELFALLALIIEWIISHRKILKNSK